jgi:hypothetical protein
MEKSLNFWLQFYCSNSMTGQKTLMDSLTRDPFHKHLQPQKNKLVRFVNTTRGIHSMDDGTAYFDRAISYAT